MGWLYLLLAGLCEIGWPIGLKLGWGAGGLRYGWLAFAIVCIITSGGLLLLALREIPVGTAYPVRTGIGAVGDFLVGITLFDDANTALRWASVALITAGIIGLKWA